MSNSISGITFAFAAYNEEEVIKDSILKINEKLTKIFGKNNFEILIAENGSTDKTKEILKSIKLKNLNPIFLKEKGHGIALKAAVEKSKYNYVVLTGADLPFGFKDLEEALKSWNDFDIIFGSKLHPESVYPNSKKRKFASNIFSNLLKIFFRLSIRDPQGSIFLFKPKVKPFLKYCDSPNAFFAAQLAIYSQRHKLKMKEIPVKFSNPKTRDSKYKISKDGPEMIESLGKEFINIKLGRKDKN